MSEHTVIDALKCARCLTTKDVVAFSVDRRRASGRNPYCKECVRKHTSAWYLANRDRERAKRTAHSMVTRRGRGIQPRKYGHGSLGGKPASQRTAEYRAKHPDRVKRTKDRVNRLFGKLYNERWRKRFPQRAKAKSARWRNQGRIATPSWADPLAIEAVYAEAIRLKAETGIDYQVDHVVPIRSKLVCGLHCEANLQIIEGSLNQRKGNRYWPDMP